jgi:hypothetical protein
MSNDFTKPQRKGVVLVALLLAFLPAVAAVGLFGGYAQSSPPTRLLVAVVILAILCCFTSSFILFRSNSGWVLLLGLLFMVLNGGISFFLGCAAFTGSIH